ncbi:MAG: lysyl endopeptidase [Planctomycetota bacterium]|jgi:lysyl endopeptidase
MKLLLSLIVGLFVFTSIAQVTNEGKPLSWKLNIDQDIAAKKLPTFDIGAVRAEDALDDGQFEKPWRFGFMHSVDFGFIDGQWTMLENGDRIWRLLISSPNALSLNFIFDDFYLPEGASVFLYNNDKSDLLGAYTPAQNQDSGMLGTWLVQGDKIWIEYFEPAEVSGQGRLHIAKATHGYRNAETFNASKGLNDSGDCNLDIDCPIGTDWEDLKNLNKRAAGILLSGGSGFCSGALINNTQNDGTPYFLTANHCYSNPAAWSFRFGWISPNPVCAATTNSSNGPTTMTLSGGTLRARNAGSDFCLVEINQPIPADWNRVWAGWDKTDNFPIFQVGIHHPSGDVMKICRDDDPATKEVNGGAQTWEIVGGGSEGGWELGVTEPGSSGSPLFDQNGRIIGQLFGGGAACAGTIDNGALDYYGRLGVSWDGGSAATRLRDWLDPSGSDPDTLDSFPPLEVFALDAAVGATIPALDCGDNTTNPIITLTNFGMNDITAATITWNIDDGAEAMINFSGTLSQNESEDFDLGEIVFTPGSHILNATLDAVNGADDDNNTNDAASDQIEVGVGYETTQMHFSLLTDDYAEETSWEFRTLSGTIIDSFGPYTATVDDNTVFEYDFDVDGNECYVLEIFDEFGDGICCDFGEGSYSLTTDDNMVVVSGGEFGSNEATEMLVSGELGVNEISFSNINMYPNPTTSLVTIELGNTTGSFSYSMVNTLGQEIGTGDLNKSKTVVDIQNLSSGIYFVLVNDTFTNRSKTLKLIKN